MFALVLPPKGTNKWKKSSYQPLTMVSEENCFLNNACFVERIITLPSTLTENAVVGNVQTNFGRQRKLIWYVIIVV